MNCFQSKTTKYQILKGTLELSNWNLISKKSFKLSGEWDFYWKTYCLSENHINHKDKFTPCIKKKKTGYMDSVFWNDFLIDGKELGGFGYATYQTKIILPDFKNLGIKFLTTNSAFCAYSDEHLLFCSGKPGIDKNSTIPSYRTEVIAFPMELYKKKSITLTIHIANFHHSRGGFNEKFILGDLKTLQKELDINLLQIIFLTGCLFFMGMYHFAIFYLLRSYSALYFAIYCIQSIVYLFCLNDLFLYKLLCLDL